MNDEATVSAIPWYRSRLGFTLFWMLCLVGAWTLLRIVLYLSFGPDGQSFGEVALAFLGGLKRDLFVALCYSSLLFLYMWVVPERIWGKAWHRMLFWSAGAVTMFLMLFLVVVEYFFFEEFKSRFNTVAVDYLIYPHEVFVNIWESYHTGIFITICAVLALAWVWGAAKWFAPMWRRPEASRTRLAWLGGALAAAILLSFGIRLNGVHVSNNRTLNEIADQGTLSFIAAFWTHQLDYSAFYRTLDMDEAYARTRRILESPGSKFLDEGRSIRRAVAGDPLKPKLNLVIILEESLGSPFWGCLGRPKTLTPNMDKLAATEGLLFTNLYASGNRTVRGMEGVLSSFPPLPGDSIVKRHLTDNVETLARVLHREGYTNIFLYGGRGLFDSMRSYSVRNGYDRFVEQKHFEKPRFQTIWGVCDEDLFQRGIEEFRAAAGTGQPFFGTMLTVSNHKPYTFPEGTVRHKQGHRESAVAYADYALGRFFEQARQEPLWTNTVFVVVADHGARVYGKQTIPIHSYEIPLVILGPAVVSQPEKIGALGCSLDVGPTVLGLMGRPYESLFFGRDLLKEPAGFGHVWLNHNRDIGMMARQRMVVLGLMKNLEIYSGDPKVAEMELIPGEPSDSDNDIARDCMAIYQVADDLYMHQRYALDPPAGGVKAPSGRQQAMR